MTVQDDCDGINEIPNPSKYRLITQHIQDEGFLHHSIFTKIALYSCNFLLHYGLMCSYLILLMPSSSEKTHTEYPDVLKYMETLNPQNIQWTKEQYQKMFEECMKKTRVGLQEFITLLGSEQSQIQTIGNSFHTRRVSHDKEIYNSPRTIVKMIQEIFGSSHNFQVWERKYLSERVIQQAIQNLVLDVRMITDEKLRLIGLEHLSPHAQPTEETEVHQRKIPVSEQYEKRNTIIPEIKDFFIHNVSPFELQHEQSQSPKKKSYFRLFAITDGEKKGYIMGTANDVHKKLFITDLHGSLRRTENILEGYESTISELKTLEKDIDTIIQFLNNWNTRDQKKIDLFSSKMTQWTQELLKVRNRNKVQIRKDLEACQDFTDKNGKISPSSRQLILQRTKRVIGKRIEEISKISGYIAADKIRILNTVFDETSKVDSFFQTVNTYKNNLAILHPEKEMTESQKNTTLENLTMLKEKVESFQYQPYLNLAKEMKSNIQKTIEHMNENNFKDAKTTFIKTFAIAKIFHTEKMLFEIQRKYFSNQRSFEILDAQQLEKEFYTVIQQAKAKQIGSEEDIFEYDTIYKMMIEYLQEIQSDFKKAQYSQAVVKKSYIEDGYNKMRKFDPGHYIQHIE